MFIFESGMQLIYIVEGALYCIQWQGDKRHCLDDLAKKFSDTEYLFAYFTQHETRLRYYNVPVSKAVIDTAKAVVLIIEQLYTWGENSINSIKPNLVDYFEHLHNVEAYAHKRFRTDYKLKGNWGEAPWIRIYAVKLEPNEYVITGFGIKLVDRMEKDADLREELKKLEKQLAT